MLLYAENQKERKRWVDKLNEAIEACQHTTRLLKKPSHPLLVESTERSSQADEEGEKDSVSTVSSGNLKNPLSVEQSQEKIAVNIILFVWTDCLIAYLKDCKRR